VGGDLDGIVAQASNYQVMTGDELGGSTDGNNSGSIWIRAAVILFLSRMTDRFFFFVFYRSSLEMLDHLLGAGEYRRAAGAAVHGRTCNVCHLADRPEV